LIEYSNSSADLNQAAQLNASINPLIGFWMTVAAIIITLGGGIWGLNNSQGGKQIDQSSENMVLLLVVEDRHIGNTIHSFC